MYMANILKIEQEVSIVGGGILALLFTGTNFCISEGIGGLVTATILTLFIFPIIFKGIYKFRTKSLG